MPWKAPTGTAGRKSPAASKSIRGTISSPIPIPDPSDEEFPIEFPMRDSVQSVTRPVRRSEQPSREEPVLDLSDSSASQNAVDRTTRPQADDHVNYSSSNSSRDPLQAAGKAGPKHPQVLRKSSTSRRPSELRRSGATTNTQDMDKPAGTPQRKKSVFRSAVSKLFGRKKKGESKDADFNRSRHTMSTIASGAAASRQQDSNSGDSREQPTTEPKKSLSLPITEYDRALRSHSIGPEDVVAIKSARNSLIADARLSARLSSVDSPTHAASPRWPGAGRLGGLAPRPASSQDRVTRLADFTDDPGEIGRAITSDHKGLRRRSRSLSVMPSFETTTKATERRRSAEIRYWRDSYARVDVVDEAEADGFQNAAGTESREPDLETEGASEVQDAPFFLAENGSDRDTLLQIAQMPLPLPLPLPLDSRVGSLEARMTRLEGIVLQLGQSIPALSQHMRVRDHTPQGPRHDNFDDEGTKELRRSEENTSGGERVRYSSRPSTRHSEASKMTFGDPQNVGESTPRATLQFQSHGSSRPGLQNSFRRSDSGLEKSFTNSFGVVTAEHYTTLISLLETERLARQTLEAQVRGLARQIQLLGKAPGTGTLTPSTSRPGGDRSVFDYDEDERDSRRATAVKHPYAGLGLEDSGIATEPRDDDDNDDMTEPFVTPHEDQGRFDIYGDENDTAQKADARALSLSLLTLGRQPLTAMPQVTQPI